MLPLTGHTFYFLPATAIYGKKKTIRKRSKLSPQNSRHLQLLRVCVHSLLPKVIRPSRQPINTAELALSRCPVAVFAAVICIDRLPLQLLPVYRLASNYDGLFRSHIISHQFSESVRQRRCPFRQSTVIPPFTFTSEVISNNL